jgi:N-acyl-D-amino-acid deacylase
VLDLVLKKGCVVDGTGKPWFFADVGIRDGVVVSVGRERVKSLETIDVDGLTRSAGRGRTSQLENPDRPPTRRER